VFVQQRDENDYIEPQMVVDNMFDDVLGSLDGKVCLQWRTQHFIRGDYKVN